MGKWPPSLVLLQLHFKTHMSKCFFWMVHPSTLGVSKTQCFGLNLLLKRLKELKDVPSTRLRSV